MKFRFLFNYPNENIQPENWNSWSWQLRNSLKTKIQYNDFFLHKNLPLQPDEVKAFDQGEKIFTRMLSLISNVILIKLKFLFYATTPIRSPNKYLGEFTCS